VWDKKGEEDESPTKRDKRLATVWNWRSVGRFGISVLPVGGSAAISIGCRLLTETAVLKSLISFERLDMWESICCLI
jgi:hypothetical protein